MLRRVVVMAGVMLVMASVASLALAQPGGGFGGGGGFGMMGGGVMGGNTSITSLLRMPQVQTELKLTDDQKTKIQDLSGTMRDKMMEAMNAGGGPPDFQNMSQEDMQKQMADMRKKMEGVNKDMDEQAVKILNADQVDRVKQLQIQRDGAMALTREDVAKKLGLTDDQTAKIKKLQESLNKPPQFDPNGDMQAQMQKMRDDRAQSQKDMLAVLTDEQKAKLKELGGKEFTFPQGGRGFGRGGGGFGGGGPGGGGGN